MPKGATAVAARRSSPTHAVRTARMVRLLNMTAAGAALSDLEAALGVSRRTVYRDLEELRNAGFVLRLHRKEGVYKCESLDALADEFTITEAAAFLLYARDGLRPRRGTRFESSLRTAVRKICRVLSVATTHIQPNLHTQMARFEADAVTSFPCRSLLFPEDPDGATNAK